MVDAATSSQLSGAPAHVLSRVRGWLSSNPADVVTLALAGAWETLADCGKDDVAKYLAGGGAPLMAPWTRGRLQVASPQLRIALQDLHQAELPLELPPLAAAAVMAVVGTNATPSTVPDGRQLLSSFLAAPSSSACQTTLLTAGISELLTEVLQELSDQQRVLLA